MVCRQFQHSFTHIPIFHQTLKLSCLCPCRAIIKLGCEGTITGFDIDTTNFRDSSPVQIKVEATVASEDLKEDDLDSWKVSLDALRLADAMEAILSIYLPCFSG
jgi:allantoicase